MQTNSKAKAKCKAKGKLKAIQFDYYAIESIEKASAFKSISKFM